MTSPEMCIRDRTNGAVEVLAVNTLGVLYIVENGGTVQSLSLIHI